MSTVTCQATARIRLSRFSFSYHISPLPQDDRVIGVAGVVLTETDDLADSFFVSGCTSSVARKTVRFISNVHIAVYKSVLC